MYGILIAGYLVIALAIIVLVLIQRGKGAEMGSSFGAGASATLFGSSGSGNFLTRTTTVLGVLFFASSIVLSNMVGTSKFSHIDVNDSTPVTTQQNTSEQATQQTTNDNPTSDIPN
ncbi:MULTISPECIES: preprotein translocase subunit SecG [unclassified Gilliamella]|uniref:preprotein translocase subunit SecG n=1 Tax=unclassified Gilliamella TaxID=2685620 RepID=UPI00226A8E37|nr:MULTISPECIES: preprotein translocase subunit SecG [unclassified Gilliamella]MCX8573919.1 preprotein translocase subunit SecG [Gilliamella sp. B3831]MCX8576150.1 preprotein translocase subunit SecG [Gilliamella sp. B3815]MCX8603251.1 preprotein translocase subunit SecG [Gilliamella sp. B3823]MCX8607132.1 preprotein translocase subunit SecG [Gilliamella sp. B3825]MCX8636650.1 preprotein translocase subunit SecG [Gilliamella sp. B3817]